MKRALPALLAFALGLALAGGAGQPPVRPVPVRPAPVRPVTDVNFPGATLVTFQAADGLPVSAFYTPAAAGAPLLLLFHQMDSNKYEYREVAPRLRQMGYASLAVDARSGAASHAGEWRNLTADAYQKKTGDTAGFSQALPDLEAALKWARARQAGHPVYVLGSSYSADLVFTLAAAHPNDVQAVLSFSPGGGADLLDTARQVRVPVFITSASDASEIETAKSVLNAVGSARKTQFASAQGEHGAAALSVTYNRDGAEAYWQAMTAFLNALK